MSPVYSQVLKRNKEGRRSTFIRIENAFESPISHKSSPLRFSDTLNIMKNPPQDYFVRSQALDQALVDELVFNLSFFATMNKNEKTIIDLIEKLVENQEQLHAIVHFKYHKKKDMSIAEAYGPHFVKRISSIRVVNDKLPPIKWKYPHPTIDTATLQKLQVFSKRLEEYNIQKKREDLKSLEEYLIKNLFGYKVQLRKVASNFGSSGVSEDRTG